MGANHKVSSPKISQDDDGAALLSKNQAQTCFQIDPKHFQKVATEFFEKNYIMEFSTD